MREERDEGMKNFPKSHRLSVQRISSLWLYCSMCNHSALVSEPPLQQRVSQIVTCAEVPWQQCH